MSEPWTPPPTRPPDRGFWIGVLIVLLIVCLGLVLFVRHINNIQDECEAKGGKSINTRGGWVCVDADAVIP